MVVLGVVIVLGGLLSAYAGIAQLRERRRVLAEGDTVWASIVPAPTHPEYEPSAYRPMLRFETEDGRVVEVYSPVSSTKRRPLVEGRRILVHYVGEDPAQVVVHGEKGPTDLLFIGSGLAAVVAAVIVMVLV
ncbi:MAG: DUF3592 domain-containing protein [Catenulispora sp.]